MAMPTGANRRGTAEHEAHTESSSLLQIVPRILSSAGLTASMIHALLPESAHK